VCCSTALKNAPPVGYDKDDTFFAASGGPIIEPYAQWSTIDEVKVYRRDVAARNDYAVYRKYFKRDMHASMVNNLARIGLLTERVRPRLSALGIDLPAAS